MSLLAGFQGILIGCFHNQVANTVNGIITDVFPFIESRTIDIHHELFIGSLAVFHAFGALESDDGTEVSIGFTGVLNEDELVHGAGQFVVIPQAVAGGAGIDIVAPEEQVSSFCGISSAVLGNSGIQGLTLLEGHQIALCSGIVIINAVSALILMLLNVDIAQGHDVDIAFSVLQVSNSACDRCAGRDRGGQRHCQQFFQHRHTICLLDKILPVWETEPSPAHTDKSRRQRRRSCTGTE